MGGCLLEEIYSENMVLDMVLRMGSILTVKDETGNEKWPSR